MVVQYAIDWESIYSVWVMDHASEACDEDELYDLLEFLKSMRRRIVRNGLLYLDARNNAKRGLVKLLKLFTQEGSEDSPSRVKVWDKLRYELREFDRLYTRSECRILVSGSADDQSYEQVQRSFDAYLKSTRLNKKKWQYPAVVLSCSLDLPSTADGFRRVSPGDYDSCEEEQIRSEWDGGCEILCDDKVNADRLVSALSVAVGAAEDGHVELFDPNWSARVLVDPPDSAWMATTRYWMAVMCCNPHVHRISIISSDVIEMKRMYKFGPFIDGALLPCCDCRSEVLRIDLGLREADAKDKGRKIFHNRYIRVGRFVVEIPNGLDIIAKDGSVRTFDCTLMGGQCEVLKKLADTRGDFAIKKSNVKNVIADHEDFMFDDIGGEAFQFHVKDRQLERCGEDNF